MSSRLKAPPSPGALLEAARRFGTPTFVYDEAVLQRQCRQLREAMTDLPARLLYAMKANPCPAVLRTMQEEGLGLDVVSPGEMELALRLGFPPQKLLFSANNMTDEEMHDAQQRGVLLNIGELSRLKRLGAAYPQARVCLRINPQVEAGHHEHVMTAGPRSKFGLLPHQLAEARATAQEHRLQIVGLHQHIGSGILNPESFGEATRVLLEAARAFPALEFLNVGGGLGVPYRPEESPFFKKKRFQSAVVDPLRAFENEYREMHGRTLSFWCEPGRYLVAEAGTLVVQVNTLKETPTRTFAGTDSGMTHLPRPALYGAYHGIYNLSNPQGPLQRYDVVGNVCEAGDVFARERPVQAIREGDVLAILDAGAYGMAMASTYNLRPLPAEVLHRADGPLELVRSRQSPDALASHWLNEDAAARSPDT